MLQGLMKKDTYSAIKEKEDELARILNEARLSAERSGEWHQEERM